MKVELRACLWRGSLLTTLPSVVWFSSCLFLAPLSTAMRYNSISPNPITAPTTIKKCNKRRIFLLDTHHQAVPPLTCCKYSRRKKWTSYGKKANSHDIISWLRLYYTLISIFKHFVSLVKSHINFWMYVNIEKYCSFTCAPRPRILQSDVLTLIPPCRSHKIVRWQANIMKFRLWSLTSLLHSLSQLPSLRSFLANALNRYFYGSFFHLYLGRTALTKKRWWTFDVVKFIIVPSPPLNQTRGNFRFVSEIQPGNCNCRWGRRGQIIPTKCLPDIITSFLFIVLGDP